MNNDGAQQEWDVIKPIATTFKMALHLAIVFHLHVTSDPFMDTTNMDNTHSAATGYSEEIGKHVQTRTIQSQHYCPLNRLEQKALICKPQLPEDPFTFKFIIIVMSFG